MCKTELLLKIFELIIAASVPALIFFWGYKLTKKMEDVKNKSAKNYLWENKWTELLFEKYKAYTEDVISVVCKYDILSIMIKDSKQELPESIALQEEINILNHKIYNEGNQLASLSNSLFGINNELSICVVNIYSNLARTANEKADDYQLVINELRVLNGLAEKITKRGFCET